MVTSQKFILCKFHPDDLDQMLQLFNDTVHTINIRDYTQEQVNVWAPQEIDRARWARSFSNHIAYVAKQNDVIIGFGDATMDGSIEHLFTHKDFQGLGVATAILRKLEQELKILGVTQLTTEASITARPFFERHDYVVVKQQEVELRGTVFINFVMSKSMKKIANKMFVITVLALMTGNSTTQPKDLPAKFLFAAIISKVGL